MRNNDRTNENQGMGTNINAFSTGNLKSTILSSCSLAMFTHLRPSLEERARSSHIFLGSKDQRWTDPGTAELQVAGAMEDEPKKEDAR